MTEPVSTRKKQAQRKGLDRRRAPDPGELKRGSEGHIGYLLRQAGAAYRLRLERALATLDVTPPQFAVLTMLKAYPGFSNADIARIALLTRPTVTVIVRNLEKNGLVVKTEHAGNSRIRPLHLTPAGLRLLATCRTRALSIEQDLLAGLSADEERQIKSWLVRVATHPDAR